MAKQDLFESALSSEGVTGKLAEVARSIYMQEQYMPQVEPGNRFNMERVK